MLLGVFLIASSVTVIIVGRAIIARTILPARAVSPTGKLITHHAIEEEVGFGEVEWVIT